MVPGVSTLRRWLAAMGVIIVVAACGGDDSATTATSPTTIPAHETTTTSTTTITPAPTTAARTTAAAPNTTTPPAPSPVTVEVVAGVVDGPGRIEVAQGDDVAVTVSTDVTDEVHVHGYDLFFDVTLETPAEIAFEAGIRGIFEVELEGGHLLLFELVVR